MYNLIIVSCLMIQASHGLEGDRTDVKTILGDPESDAYIDQILENLRQMILDQGLDPMDLPDLETGFSDTILGITWHGSATVIIPPTSPPSRSHLCLAAEERSVLGSRQHREDWRHQLHCGRQRHRAHRHARHQSTKCSL